MWRQWSQWRHNLYKMEPCISKFYSKTVPKKGPKMEPIKEANGANGAINWLHLLVP